MMNTQATLVVEESLFPQPDDVQLRIQRLETELKALRKLLKLAKQVAESSDPDAPCDDADEES